VNNAELSHIISEFQTALVGQKLGRIFPLSKLSCAIDFRSTNGQFLFISVEPGDPRTYFIRRRLKELERSSVNPVPFFLTLRKHLSNAELEVVSKLTDERVIIFKFNVETETGEQKETSIAFQLTGRSANLFLLDEIGTIVDRLRETTGDGQEVGTHYTPPAQTLRSDDAPVLELNGKTLSETLDEYHLAKELEDRFRSRADAARRKLRGEIAKKRKLQEKLRGDLTEHGDAERWKRYGDLLLANVSNARREDDRIFVIDYFDAEAPEVEIAGDYNLSISDVAGKYFKRYTKARNAGDEIARRMKEIEKELKKLETESERLEQAIDENDESFFAPVDRPRTPTEKKKDKDSFNGARVFKSSDGYEILVGKKAKDNDHLTFRVARSLDLWFHAADYPGSHVVVKNPNRKDVPHQTLLEAAQLAAFYSDAREQTKAAVNYTQKKFVNKPRGAAPGLVRLSSFKTILVVPQVPPNKNAA
jgi:predicted ribosome quality control (RQC) complex YloA/Tae2 family protein